MKLAMHPENKLQQVIVLGICLVIIFAIFFPY